MSLFKFKYSTIMANEADIKSECKALEEEAESIVIVDYKLIGFEYGAPVAVSRPSNYKDRLLMATACCCCCGLAAVKCSNNVNSKLRVGDMEGARKASDKTLFYTNTAVLTGLGILIAISLLFIAILLVLIFMGIDVASRGFHF